MDFYKRNATNLQNEWFEPINPERVVQICECVFQLLHYDDAAIDDLSLPPRESINAGFHDVMSRIFFSFKMLGDEYGTPISTTNLMSMDDHEIVVNIFYTNYELTHGKNIVEARVLHASTHALRCAMISTCEQEGVPIERLMSSTPSKNRHAMLFAAAREEVPLYKLDVDTFQGGYYMQHRMLGGVWVTLGGHILDDCERITPLNRNAGMYFRIVRKLPTKKYIQTDCGAYLAFDGLQGFTHDGSETTIYHSGPQTTGHDHDERCGTR